MSTKTRSHQTERRGRLLAELFLQELDPEFVAQPTADDFVFDYLIGFANEEGGVNTYAVEVKATEKPVGDSYQVPRQVFNRFAHSNIPLLLLVVDVKRNSLFYAWPSPDTEIDPIFEIVSIAVTPVNDESRTALRQRLVMGTRPRT